MIYLIVMCFTYVVFFSFLYDYALSNINYGAGQAEAELNSFFGKTFLSFYLISSLSYFKSIRDVIFIFFILFINLLFVYFITLFPSVFYWYFLWFIIFIIMNSYIVVQYSIILINPEITIKEVYLFSFVIIIIVMLSGFFKGLHVQILLAFYFPLINSFFDWLSLGFTRGLLTAIYMKSHSLRRVFSWGVIDLLIAFLFLFSLITTFVLSIKFINIISGKNIIDIHAILLSIQSSPTSVDNWWIYLMLLSTLVPTIVHFSLVGGAITLWLPKSSRLKVSSNLKKDIHKIYGVWAYITFTPYLGFILFPIVFLSFLWWVIITYGVFIGKQLISWAYFLT